MNSALPNNIKIIRKLHGTKQEIFAQEFTKVTRAMQQSYETGKAEPSGLYMQELARIAGLSVEELTSEILDSTRVKIVDNTENANQGSSSDSMNYPLHTLSDKRLKIVKPSEKTDQPDSLEDTVKIRAETILVLTKLLSNKFEKS